MNPLRETPTLFNIPAGHSFADALAQGILERTSHDPLALSDYTILLPSRRACRTLREAFLRLSGGTALLLPVMRPIGDIDADEVALFLADEQDVADSIDIPPAVSKLERQLLLAHTVQRANPEQSFDQAAALALELGHFLDEVQTENVSFDKLQNLVPDEFAGHWQKTLEFLKILTEHWPIILGSRGVIDQALRRNLLLEAQIKAWTKYPPQSPVIAAGSTGTVPAAAALLSLVAHLPQGMLIFPGLDCRLDDDSWNKLGEDHPQFNMKKLLSRLKAERSDVKTWELQKAPRLNNARVRLLSEAMRPAETSDTWRQLTAEDVTPQALEGFTRIDCDTPQEEADVIALLMREALETPEKTCALITPDRQLGRRVSLSLSRWGIKVDDSGGQPLTEMPVGTWILLTAEMAAEQLAPVTLLAFLKHPYLAAEMAPEVLRDRVYLLDKIALRGPRPATGFQGIRDAVFALPDKLESGKKSLLEWLDSIEPAMTAFVTMMSSPAEKPFHDMLSCHLHMTEQLASTIETRGDRRMWQGEGGEAAGTFMDTLLSVAGTIPPLKPQQYIALMGMLLKTVTVRARYGAHPRLGILGQIEARLYCADMVILGGLNEGTWPDLPAHDPWMSRPMRKQFGLPSPEKSISLSSHDFMQAASAPDVIVTRARKVNGTPTVPARWLLRIETVLKAVGLEWSNAPAAKYRQWVKNMDMPNAVIPITRPAPCPPVSARPRQLSVTKIESWMRDPYQIYAQYILGLKSLDDIDADAGGAERGTFIHSALEKFIQKFPDALPDNAVAELLDFGRSALAALRISPEVEAFWWPRFEKIAAQFVEQEREWRHSAKPYLTETTASWKFENAAGGFTLTAKADRIDKCRDDTYAVIDYKSGYIPTAKEMQSGLSPQLPLEALMVERGAFEKMPNGKVSALIYWNVSNAGQKPPSSPALDKLEQMIVEAETGLKTLVEKFDDPATPYISQPKSAAKARFSDYTHLSRIKEWGVAGDEDEDAA